MKKGMNTAKMQRLGAPEHGGIKLVGLPRPPSAPTPTMWKLSCAAVGLRASDFFFSFLVALEVALVHTGLHLDPVSEQQANSGFVERFRSTSSENRLTLMWMISVL